MTSTTEKSKMVQYLDEYCFQNIWNATNSEYRGNFQLKPVNSRLQISSFIYDNSVVGLPTTDTCMVYTFATSLLQGSFTLTDTNWHSLSDIATTYGVKLSVYDIGGHLLPMCGVWVLTPAGSGITFVAVAKTPFLKCIPSGLAETLYMTVFKNTRSSDEPWAVYSAQMSKTTDADTAIGNAKLATSGTAFAVINGISYPSLGDIPARAVGDYVDVGIDPTISTEFVVSVADQGNGYMSTKYAGHREILHCPKDSNVNSWLLTHDGATLFVRDVDTKKSVYFHRVDPLSVKQITHNDISASATTIQAFQDALGATEVEVVVRVRPHKIHRVLMTESAWIADLYLCDDATIIQILAGNGDSTLTFWTAAYLEQSGYISMMFEDVDTTDPTDLSTYVDSLGYYAVGAILASNMYSGTYTQSDLAITKSFAQIGKTITPLVFIADVKVPQSRITSTDYDDYRTGISITNASSYANGATVNVQTLDYGDPTPTRFTPSSTNTTLTVSDNLFSLYAETTDETFTGYGRSASTAYVYTPLSSNTYQVFENTDGTYDVTFTSAMYGTTIVIPPPRFMWYESYTIDTQLQNAEPLIFPITQVASDGTVVPLLGYGSIQVFLNGKYLVRDVDYKLDPGYGTNTGGTMLLDLIVTCASFMDVSSTGNLLEIFISTDRNPSRDVGYAVNNILARTNLVSFWYPRISAAFVEGVLTTDLLDCAVYMTPQSSVSNGSLFELKPTYPEIVSELLSDYTPLDDETTITTINTFLGRTVPETPSIVTLTQEHEIYSPYITAIGSDLVNDKITITDDPDDTAFLAQFDAYQYLKDRDPTLTQADSRVNRHYLSIAACYTQFPTMTATETKLIQRLIKLVLIPSTATIGDTLV